MSDKVLKLLNNKKFIEKQRQKSLKGEKGERGLQGQKGAQGAKGERGIDGKSGADGVKAVANKPIDVVLYTAVGFQYKAMKSQQVTQRIKYDFR